MFLKGVSYDLGLMIKNSYNTPTLLVNNVIIPKSEDEWDDNLMKCASWFLFVLFS